MVEGTPPELPAPSEPPVTTEPAPEAEPVESGASTVEEVEAFWKNRIAGKDRSHAAESETLRSQLAAERAAREAAESELRTKQEGEMTDAERWKAQAEEANRRADAAEQQRVIDVRSAKYAAAAEHLDPSALASMDEAKLATLNARLTDLGAPAPTVVDPNAPRRQTPSATPASPQDKSVDELEADLKKYAPEFQADIAGR